MARVTYRDYHQVLYYWFHHANAAPKKVQVHLGFDYDLVRVFPIFSVVASNFDSGHSLPLGSKVESELVQAMSVKRHWAENPVSELTMTNMDSLFQSQLQTRTGSCVRDGSTGETVTCIYS